MLWNMLGYASKIRLTPKAKKHDNIPVNYAIYWANEVKTS
jgi:hypothetical protein